MRSEYSPITLQHAQGLSDVWQGADQAGRSAPSAAPASSAAAAAAASAAEAAGQLPCLREVRAFPRQQDAMDHADACNRLHAAAAQLPPEVRSTPPHS